MPTDFIVPRCQWIPFSRADGRPDGPYGGPGGHPTCQPDARETVRL